MIKWIFFDIGNVLFNDDPQNFRFYEFVYETLNQHQHPRTFASLMQEREHRVQHGEQWISRKILLEAIGETETKNSFHKLHHELKSNYDENHLLQDQLHDCLDKLKSNFKMGIIANQVHECRDSLKRRDLLHFFDVIAISDELDLHKPDVEFYSWALQESGANPADCLMIGDRIDNDVQPAQQLGMKTMLLHWDSWKLKNWQPHNDHARIFLDSCERIPMFGFKHVAAVPDIQVGNFQAIPEAIQQLTQS